MQRLEVGLSMVYLHQIIALDLTQASYPMLKNTIAPIRHPVL